MARFVAALVALPVIVFAATSASAQQAKCLAGKTKCATSLGNALLKCERLARTPGKPADPNAKACRDKAEDRFDGGLEPSGGCFEKLEAKAPNDCLTFDDAAATSTAVAERVGDVIVALDPAVLDQTRCGAGKLKCVEKLYVSLLKCHGLAQTPGKPADPNAKDCLAKARAKFDGGLDPLKGCFEKVESKVPSDCQTVDDTAAVAAMVEGDVDELVEALANPDTTASAFDLRLSTAPGACGTTFRDLAGTVPLKQLACGTSSLGGGETLLVDWSQPIGALRFGLPSCNGTLCDLGPAAPGTTPPGVACTDVGCPFGPPAPVPNAGLTVCAATTVSAPPSGTLDLATGAATLNVDLTTSFVVTPLAHACPICAVSLGGAPCAGTPDTPCTGVCDGGSRHGLTCATAEMSGLTADCPMSFAVTPGARRCYRGTNNDASCTAAGDCESGWCVETVGTYALAPNPLTTSTSSLTSASGQFCTGQGPAQAGAFRSDICGSGPNSGAPCSGGSSSLDPASCGAGVTCRPGHFTNYCVGGTEDGKGCSSNTNCGGGTCTKAGRLAQRIDLMGAPAGPLALGEPAAITLVAAYCAPATSSLIANSRANIPAPAATSLAGTVTLVP